MSLDVSKIGRKTFISQNALAEVLQAVKESGALPQHTSRSTVKRRRDEAVNVDTPYGHLLQVFEVEKDDGSKLSLSYVNPAALLHHASKECPRMQSLFKAAMEQFPNDVRHKWTLMLYMDQVSPGNQLKVHNRRKLQCIYFSVKEFGGFNLAQEHAWCVLTCVRTDVANQLKGGVSQLFKACIKLFFGDACNFEHGIQVWVGNTSHVLCFSLGYIVADEAALKQAFDCKGASGKMLCMSCQTTVSRRYAPHPLGRFILHTEHDSSKFVLHSDRSVWQIVDHLHGLAAVLPNGQFKDEEMRLGFNYCPSGALLDVQLRETLKPITQMCYDPMHVYMVAGIWHKEVNLLLDLLHRHGYRQAQLHQFCGSFIWPHIHGGASCPARLVFQKKRDADSDFKCGSAETLAIYPVIRAFVQHVVQDAPEELQLGLNSYLRCCDVLDNLKHAATGHITGSQLRPLIESHLQAFKESRHGSNILFVHLSTLHLWWV